MILSLSVKLHIETFKGIQLMLESRGLNGTGPLLSGFCFSNQFHWPLGIFGFCNHRFNQLRIENSVDAFSAADSQLSTHNAISQLWFVDSGDAESRLLRVKSYAQIFDYSCSVPRTPTLFKCQLYNKKSEVGHLWSQSLLGELAVTAELLDQ